ncbi:hypothetical protein E2562_003409 [Oryza meyeriana var. granulata]|uniref:Uncharacterized protein n=1 Tax=Oryza meyeriana var. granulata TaxID=110450 RepID=A0A6G1EEI7_9ORYZ|nr:hypothetical protein E2562_003409 [Oryza meyeriana var. granulata]
MLRGGAKNTSNELPVEGVVRVRKVEKIQAYNLVTKPSSYASTRISPTGQAESMAVTIVRVGAVAGKTDGVIPVTIAKS